MPALTEENVLQPPGGYEGELEFAALGSAGQSPFSTHDPSRTAGRLKEREEKRQACMCANLLCLDCFAWNYNVSDALCRSGG